MIKSKLNWKGDATKVLDNMRRQVVNRILKKAARAAIKPVVTQIRSGAPVRSGALKKSIASKVDTYGPGRKVVLAIAGPRTKFSKVVGKKTIRPSRTAHLIEFGSKRNKAKPFIGRALTALQSQVQSTMIRILGEEIKKELAK